MLPAGYNPCSLSLSLFLATAIVYPPSQCNSQANRLLRLTLSPFLLLFRLADKMLCPGLCHAHQRRMYLSSVVLFPSRFSFSFLAQPKMLCKTRPPPSIIRHIMLALVDTSRISLVDATRRENMAPQATWGRERQLSCWRLLERLT